MQFFAEIFLKKKKIITENSLIMFKTFSNSYECIYNLFILLYKNCNGSCNFILFFSSQKAKLSENLIPYSVKNTYKTFANRISHNFFFFSFSYIFVLQLLLYVRPPFLPILYCTAICYLQRYKKRINCNKKRRKKNELQ